MGFKEVWYAREERPEAGGVEGFASLGMDGQGETHKRDTGFCLFVVNRRYLVPWELAKVKCAFCNLF